MFNKIAIIGVGLIGGSIGLAIKEKRLAKEVIGVCRHRESLGRAKRIGAIDNGTLNYKEAVKGADLVILATPILQIIKIGQQIIPYLKRGCLLTDVGSTKVKIVQALERRLPEEISFVGAHPLAGSEKRGVEQARANLFAGCMCICTRSKKTELAALRRISAFWRRIGCKVVYLTPHTHDRVLSLVSHLPHIAVTQLVKVGRSSLDFAASGFRDTTRIASSDAQIWTDIFLSNKRFIRQALDAYIKSLQRMKRLIGQGDRRGLVAELKQAKALRDAWQK